MPKDSPKTKSGDAPTNKQLLFRYLHRRMLVNIEMHGTDTVLGKSAPPPPSDPILDLVTSGNAYRHLDKADREEGEAFLKLVGAKKGAKLSDTHLEQLLMLCFLRMSGFNEKRMKEWASKRRKHSVDGISALPCNEEEALAFATWMQNNQTWLKEMKGKGEKMFAGAGHQTQGFRWIAALRSWFGRPPHKGSTLSEVAREVRKATTWKEANEAVTKLQCVADYTGAQGLCTLLFGVCGGDASLVFAPSFDKSSMTDWCAYGPGPTTAIKKIFGENKNTLEGINELRCTADKQFEALDLDFPYLRNEDGHKRPLTCVDLEHSLCYFSRYLNIRSKMSPSQQEELHKFIEPAIKKGQVKRWKIKQLADLSFDGAMREAQEKLEAKGLSAGAAASQAPTPQSSQRGKKRPRA